MKISNYKSLEKIEFELPHELDADDQMRLKIHSSGEIPEAPCLLILGENATDCIRPPYYRADAETYRRAELLGLRVIIGNVRPQDWNQPGADVIAQRIVYGAAPDAVVVLHDGGGDRHQTVEGLQIALAQLQGHNYSFEPICQ